MSPLSHLGRGVGGEGAALELTAKQKPISGDPLPNPLPEWERELKQESNNG